MKHEPKRWNAYGLLCFTKLEDKLLMWNDIVSLFLIVWTLLGIISYHRKVSYLYDIFFLYYFHIDASPLILQAFHYLKQEKCLSEIC